MEAVSNKIATIPFAKPEFGALVLLPDKVKAWKTETDTMKAAADTFKTELASTDLSQATLDTLDKLDTRLNGAIVKISTAFTRIEADRKAGTGIIDEVKAYAMMPEKTIASLPAELKTFRDNIAREKAKRAKVAEEMKQKEIDKKNEAVEIRAYQVSIINKNYATAIAALIKAMYDKFNVQTEATFPAYKGTLEKYTPTLTDKDWTPMTKNGGVMFIHWTVDEVDGMLKEVSDAERPKIASEWIAKLTEERDRLLEIIPSRISELEAIAKDASLAAAAKERMIAEQNERDEQLAKDAKDKADAIASNVQVEQMNNVFDTEAATPTISLAKGTQVKKKYAPATAANWLPIIQSWVKNDLPSATQDDLAKKIGFMLTSANNRLNDGEALSGVAVEDDYSTRSSKK